MRVIALCGLIVMICFISMSQAASSESVSDHKPKCHEKNPACCPGGIHCDIACRPPPSPSECYCQGGHFEKLSCACCRTCVIIQGEGQECYGGFGGTEYQCRRGLVCENGYCVRETSEERNSSSD